MSCCACNLIPIIVDSNHLAPSESSNLSRWTPNATSNIQNLHSPLDAQFICQVMLVARQSLEEGLADSESTEME